MNDSQLGKDTYNKMRNEQRAKRAIPSSAEPAQKTVNIVTPMSNFTKHMQNLEKELVVAVKDINFRTFDELPEWIYQPGYAKSLNEEFVNVLRVTRTMNQLCGVLKDFGRSYLLTIPQAAKLEQVLFQEKQWTGLNIKNLFTRFWEGANMHILFENPELWQYKQEENYLPHSSPVAKLLHKMDNLESEAMKKLNEHRKKSSTNKWANETKNITQLTRKLIFCCSVNISKFEAP